METDSYGVFLQAHYDFTDKLNATLGAATATTKNPSNHAPIAEQQHLTAAEASDRWADTDYRATCHDLPRI
jgi:hypothetical protein